ncbi:MAG: hypothetical protein WCJ37_02040 [Syntrophus sp. (in: bacteria)]
MREVVRSLVRLCQEEQESDEATEAAAKIREKIRGYVRGITEWHPKHPSVVSPARKVTDKRKMLVCRRNN